tara:strand:- start:2658 stop:3368 length:711 start_codon:yes stop_codon:yes gene_type:complete
MNKIKVSKTSRVVNFKYNNTQYTFIGETHSGLKNDISPQIQNGLLLLECPKRYNDLQINKILKHYQKSVKDNKKIKNESYIDLSILYFTNKYVNILNKNKKLKEIVKNEKIKIICIDERNPIDFLKIQVDSLYRKGDDHKQYKIIKNIFIILKKEIKKMKKSKIKDNLLNEINEIIENKMKTNSNYIVQTLSEIILDFEIINNYILNDKIKEKHITAILGRNHVKNIIKYLDLNLN